MIQREKISPAELLREVRLLEMKARNKARDILSGGYQSSFKGMGITFSEVRPYQYGDDIRSIDWNVTAKTGKPYVKLFEEERELPVILAVDVSNSTLFGAHGRTVSRQITELSASLALTVQMNGDRIGLLLFSSKVEQFLPPKKGRSQLLRVFRELVLLEERYEGTDLSAALLFLRRVLKRHHLIFVISDFLDEGYMKNLSLLAQKHEVVGVRIWDSFYDRLPEEGLVQAKDPETSQRQLIDFGGADRTRLMQLFQNYTAYFKDAFIRAKSDSVTIRTEDSAFKKMLEFFSSHSSKSRQ